MKGNFEIVACAALLVLRINCIVIKDNNVTTTEPTIDTDYMKTSSSSSTSSPESVQEKQSRNGESEISSDYRITTSPTTTTTHRIPPTLLNTKVEAVRVTTENNGKSLKDLV